MTPRELCCIGVDLGVSDPSAVVLVSETVGKLPIVRGFSSLAAFEPGTRVLDVPQRDQLANINAHAHDVLDAIIGMAENVSGPVRVAVEGYADIGKGMARGRFLVPMLIGALYTAATERAPISIDPHRWAWHQPSVLSHYRGAVHPPRADRTAHLKAMDRTLCNGWQSLTTDHLRAAAAHALYELGVMRSERLHLPPAGE